MGVAETFKAAVSAVFHPAPSREAVTARENAELITQKVNEFSKHQDVLGNMVRKVSGQRPQRRRSTA